MWTVRMAALAQYAAFWLVNRFHVFLNLAAIRQLVEPIVWPEMMWAGRVGSGYHDDND